MTYIIQNEPSWIIIILLGTIIGYFFPYLAKGIFYISRLPFKKHYLAGEWNSYYQVWVNNLSVLKHEQWTISRGYNSKLKVKITNVTGTNLNYFGELIEERGYLIVTTKAKEYNEKVFGRYTIPVPSNDSIMVGLWLGLDFNGHAIVGTNVISRVELLNEEVLVLISEYTEMDSINEIIRLKY